MGGFLGDIRGRSVGVDCALLNSSHSKLIEYYSSYKSICEGFTITVSEYTQIFGASQTSFSVWDSRGRGRLDAIEMFSGLVVFSRIRYQQKIKFLFEMFDFNEEGFLAYESLAFLLLNVCNATYKLLAIPKQLPHATLEVFLDDYFTHHSQVRLPHLLRWTTKNRTVLDYFQAIGYDVEHPPDDRRIDPYTSAEAKARIPKPKVYVAEKELRLDTKLLGALQGVVGEGAKASEVGIGEGLNLGLEWVFGIETGRQKVRYVRVERQRAGSERVIYSVGKLVVVYFPKLNEQRFYKGHTQPISVIEVSRGSRLAASAESGQYPGIHVWDLETRLNLCKFKRIHKYTIKFLKFFRSDRYLITASEAGRAGGTVESPLVVLRLDTKEVVMSTYLSLPLIGVWTSQQGAEGPAFLVGSSSVTLLYPNQRAFSLQKCELQGMEGRKVIAFAFLHNTLITAHSGRQFFLWDEKYLCMPLKYDPLSSREVLQLAVSGETLVVLDEADIQLVSVVGDVAKTKRVVGLFESRLYNLSLQWMQVIEGGKLLVGSEFGDVIKVSDIEGEARLQKYYQLFRLEDASEVFIANLNTLLFIGGRFLYLVDRHEKELRVLSKYDFEMNLADLHKETLVTVTNLPDNKGSVLNLLTLGDLTVRENYRLDFAIEDVKITENYVIALSENFLAVFHRSHEKYFQKETIHKLAVGKLLSFAREHDHRFFFIINDVKELFRLTLTGASQMDIQKLQPDSKDKQEIVSLQQLTLLYPEQLFKYPLVVCPKRRMVALGRKNGDILLWESLSAAFSSFSSHTLLALHNDKVTRLLLDQDHLFSVGEGMASHFAHRQYQEQEDQNGLYQEEPLPLQQNFPKKGPSKIVGKESEQRKAVYFRELQGSSLREGEVEMMGLTQPDNAELKQMIQGILVPSDKLTYISQAKEPEEPDSLTLALDTVYGMEVGTHAVHYIHSYPASHSITKKDIDQSYWQEEPSDGNKEEIQFAKNALLPLDEDHNSCRRQILYSCDRLCVLHEKNAPQQLYKFHRRKVSAVAVHPNKQLVCSCEVSSQHPELHLWKHQERTTFITLSSRHRSIITKAEFSRDGEWIVTLGGTERAHSIQVFSWENQESVAFRLIEDQIIRDILFNPYDKRQLCCAGLGLIRIYRIEEELIIKEECRVPEQNFQAIAYTSNVYGSDIESDLITGSSEGDIGLYVCGSFLYSRKKAHQKGITCLRLVELFQYKRALISGGSDGYVRIWDIKFNEISRKNIRDELYSIKNCPFDMPETNIISIDIYQCLKKQGGESSGSALMLIATSDGSVLEATITNEFQGYRAVSLLTAESQSLKEKINFDISLSFTSPPSQNGFKSLVCNNLLITCSIKSKFLYFWNLIFRTREKIHPLSSPPLFLTKMKTKSIILVGLQEASGISLKLLELEWSAGIYLRAINLRGQIEVQKGNFIPKGAQFSTQDNKLAVKMKYEDIEEIWLYDRVESSPRQDTIQYSIRLRIQEKNPLFIMRANWFEFSTKEDGLMVAWHEFKQESFAEVQTRYKCYDCNNGNILALNCFSFDRFDFSAKVKASYLPCFQLAGQNQKDYIPKDNISITTMIQHGRHLLMGTSSGQILIVQSDFFSKKEGETKYFAKCIVVADSQINMLQIRENDLIVSSESGEAVYILKIKMEKCKYLKEINRDLASQCISAEELDKKLKDTYLKRKKIENEAEFVSINCGIDLKLSAVIGRNAFYKRNNIFIDLKDNIISFSGCNLLIMKHEPGQRLVQRIIKPDVSSNTCHPEISCIVLGDCKRFLLVGTSEENAKIIAWDISTNTNLFDIKLNGFIIINLLKLSFSDRHAIVLSTAKNGHQYLLFIDLINKGVLAVHHFHKNIQINDLCFFLGQEYRILACGTKYMAQWNYCNNILSEKMYSFNSELQNEDIKAASVIFYSLIFIDDYAISSGSDGYLYVWKDEKVVKRQNAHPNKEPILSLYTSINSKIFVSGANNGIVIIWHFSSSLIIQKLDEYSICAGKQPKEAKQSKFFIKYQVQSICMTKESLIVGNRAGEIVHFPFSVNSDKNGGTFVTSNKVPLPILSGFNHQIIKSCAFNTSSRKLYVLTQAEVGFGTFSVFDLSTLQKIKQDKLTEIKSPIICMLACKLSSRIFIVQKGAIATYSYQAQVKDDKYNKLLKNRLMLKCELEIKTAVMNNDETFLAVLVAPGPLQNAKIDIYALTAQDSQFYIHYMVVENLQASIDVIDFCTDHEYLVYQGADDQQTIIDLMTKQKIKAGTLENPPEWNQEAKRATPSIKEITTFFSEENKLLKVVQVKDKGVITTDEIGSVRVFAYPITANKQQNYQVYIEHLNHIYICVLSPDNRTLVTVSRQDRAIHIWEVIYS